MTAPPLDISKVNAATLVDRVAHLLATQIRGGAYPVNARLPTEKFMSEEYGVSRTVVREAIARLKSAHLVETRQGSGTVVLDSRNAQVFRLETTDQPPAIGVVRILELRRGIEAEMAALAAERRTETHRRRIERALRAIDKAVDAGRDGVDEDLAFHVAVADACGNPHYPALLALLNQALHDAISVTRENEARRADFAAAVRAEHWALYQAIAERDSASARQAAYLHMRNTANRITDADGSFWTGNRADAANRLARAELNVVLGQQATRKSV
jgi:DNA-binding FadR family transcriptional regulator